MQTTTTQRRSLLPTTGEWRLDASRSRIGFTVRKHGFGTVRGRFLDASASIAIAPGETTIEGSVSVASIDTRDRTRDAHLLDDGFFRVAQHPEMRFRARGAALTDEGWRIAGELTIRGTSRPLELLANAEPSDDASPRLTVRGALDRRDFGLTWSRAIEASGVVSSTVRLELDLVFELAAAGVS